LISYGTEVYVVSTILPDKETYTLSELFSNLPIKDSELCKRAKISKVTLYYLKTGKKNPYRSTVNSVLNVLSEVYGKTLNLDNVTGITIQQREAWNKRKKLDQEESAADE